ncbi:putative aspartyl protease [Novosphingobium hassiacum]|uniref:Putative aspartyl protease n=1 Tax=Novosphingobium hassiacum TaxID=173676 RepID=A0A7W6EWX3_9SPHN|nr:retropepsin-like aspartic protease [Novosphingobium hassiacum]MBB3861812.1 putative aspartyl protease [Novosphingobium hassiacum]
MLPPIAKAGMIIGLALTATSPAHAQIVSASDPALLNPELVLIQRDNHNRMTVPVHIGTQGPFEFLIDTGSERTVLSRQVATTLGLAISGNSTVVGVAGSIPVDLVDVDEISLGKRSYYTLTAPLLEGAHIGADGIVGLDSLQDQRVLIDFAANHIAIGDAMSLGGTRGFEIVVRAKRRSGQLIMTNAIVDGVSTDIVIDTGSDSSIGNLALRNALRRRGTSKSTVLFSVTGQSIGAEMQMASVIDVNGLRLHNTFLSFADAPAFRRLDLVKRPAMLMGMTQLRMFKRVAIDFASRRVLFDLPTGVAGLISDKVVF